MMEAAAAAAGGRIQLLGVTMLTSLGESAIPPGSDGVRLSLEDHVVRLAGEARAAGLDGVVASPLEAGALRRSFEEGFLLVTPGIRLPHQARHDQRRVATPRSAREAGADYLVIGRAVTDASDPSVALDAVEYDLAPAARGSC
jgi:orotidine-5'-phosphate decarboxylase